MTKKVEDKKTPETLAKVPAKKSNVGLIITIVVVIFVALPALGVGAFWWFAGKRVQDVANKLDNGEVTLNVGGEAVSVNTSENQKWPTTLPSFVPEYTDGDLLSSGKIGDTWSVIIENTSKPALLAYQSSLVSAGWKIDDTVEMGTLVSFNAERDNYKANLSMTTDENGKVTLLYSVTSETK